MLTPQKKKGQSRAVVSFNSILEKKLASYVTAATAAGLALSAVAPEASARIVYTPTNIGISTPIDINGDGIPDFRFGFDAATHGSALVIHPLVAGNGVVCYAGSKGCFEVVVGAVNQAVGPLKQFASNTASDSFGGNGVFMALGGQYQQTYFFGPWAYANNRYVGVRFMIEGKIHYGWIRMSVGNWIKGQPITISGYAYETIPNKRILEGDTTGLVTEQSGAATETAEPPRATLGVLAGGAGALSIWRRENE
jgi:hypothetical protein